LKKERKEDRRKAVPFRLPIRTKYYVLSMTFCMAAIAIEPLAWLYKKGSKNWLKAKRKLARLHYRVACVREDILQKLTTETARTCGLVGVESLDVKGLIQNR
jgi:Probable transposase